MLPEKTTSKEDQELDATELWEEIASLHQVLVEIRNVADQATWYLCSIRGHEGGVKHKRWGGGGQQGDTILELLLRE